MQSHLQSVAFWAFVFVAVTTSAVQACMPLSGTDLFVRSMDCVQQNAGRCSSAPQAQYAARSCADLERLYASDSQRTASPRQTTSQNTNQQTGQQANGLLSRGFDRALDLGTAAGAFYLGTILISGTDSSGGTSTSTR